MERIMRNKKDDLKRKKKNSYLATIVVGYKVSKLRNIFFIVNRHVLEDKH